MVIHENISAWIAIDGVPANEYEITHSTGERGEAVVTCWIESIAGKEFSVNWKDHAFDTPTEGVVSIDGHRCAGNVIEKAQRAMSTITGVRSSDNARKPFMFAKVVTTDDDAFLDTPPSHELGDIRITITETRIVGRAPRRPGNGFRPNAILQAPSQVHERSKKSAVHHAGFGKEVRVGGASQTKLIHKRIGPPIMTFVFKYRPMDILRAEGIAPRPEQFELGHDFIYVDSDTEDAPVVDRRRVKREDVKPVTTSHHDIVEIIDLT